MGWGFFEAIRRLEDCFGGEKSWVYLTVGFLMGGATSVSLTARIADHDLFNMFATKKLRKLNAK
jgi:hypothetical protein